MLLFFTKIHHNVDSLEGNTSLKLVLKNDEIIRGPFHFNAVAWRLFECFREYGIDDYYLIAKMHFTNFTDSEILEIKSEYNNEFLKRNPDVLLIKPESEEVEEMYREHKTFHEGDSGLDLFCVRDQKIYSETIGKIKLGIQCQANSSFWLLPRSSISKTPLRMANSIGLIDKGYRGELMGVVDNIDPLDIPSNSFYIIHQGDRLFQIAFPDLREIRPIVTDFLTPTTRGEGGFGSTNVPSKN